MTVFDLAAQFSEAMKTPFSLRWTPHTAKFIGIFLLLYGGAILFYYTGQKEHLAPARNMAPRQRAVSGSWIRSTATRGCRQKRHSDAAFANEYERQTAPQKPIADHRRRFWSGQDAIPRKPNLMLANASFIVTDPKGEMLRAVGNLFLEEGYVLRVFDLIDPSKLDCYNPFCYIRKDADVFKLIDKFPSKTPRRKVQKQMIHSGRNRKQHLTPRPCFTCSTKPRPKIRTWKRFCI